MSEPTAKETNDAVVYVANSIFCSIFKINDELLVKSNDLEYEPTFNEIFDFHITSQGLGLLKNICTDNVMSAGTFLTVRCMIESIALKKMYACGKIGKEHEDLLKIQFKIIEWNAYKEYAEEDPRLFSSDIKDNYEKSKSMFLKHVDKSTFDKMERSYFLFLCEKKNAVDIVEEYLPEYLETYKICSQFIHPNDNQLLYRQKSSFGDYCRVMVRYLLEEYIINKPADKLSEKTFQDWYEDCTGQSRNAKEMNLLVTQFNDELSKISNVLRQFFGDNTFHANTLDVIQKLMVDLYYDNVFGLTEQTKGKFKIILELFATSGEFHKDDYHVSNMEKFYQLLVIHTQNQFNRNLGVDSFTKYAYELYKELYPNGFERTIFDKNFEKMTGFLTTDREPPTLKKLCKDYVSELKSIEQNSNLKINQVCILNYVESHMLSHSNGYIWYANRGAFNDNFGVGQFLKLFTMRYLAEVYGLYRVHSVMFQTNEYKRIINILRNSIKRLEIITSKLSKLELETPKIDISGWGVL